MWLTIFWGGKLSCMTSVLFEIVFIVNVTFSILFLVTERSVAHT